uniref:Pancreatic trypsin inhibitor n=1 Tax=Rhipicephalus appendiculatus TaxID=34631 RepID=A0A131Z3V5_RHIAP
MVPQLTPTFFSETCVVMASAPTLVMMLLPVILPFILGAYASKDLEERRDLLECDRRLIPMRLCRYPASCQCHPRAPLGERSYMYYRYERGHCRQGAYMQNCNGFPSHVACHSACVRQWG